MKYVTIIDIARELNISKSTVSRALSGDTTNVRPETMALVLETAKSMGYQRNETAVNLRKQSSKIIGVVIPDASTPFFMTFVQYAQNELKKRGYHTVVVVANENPEIERDYIEMLVRSRVDGIMLSACHMDKNIDLYRKVIARGIPIVFFDRTVEGLDASSVRMDDETMSAFMVEALIRKGKRHIVNLGGPQFVLPAVGRTNGYRYALHKFNIEYDKRYDLQGGLTYEDGAKAMRDFLALGLEFDAMFCFTETTMLGAKGVLQSLHYRIPEDVAVCTVSGTKLCTFVHPTISAVEQHLDEIAEHTSRILINQIEYPTAPKENIVIRGEIVHRQSTENT